MENQSERRENRRREIGERIEAIRVRVNDLQRPVETRIRADSSEKLIQAQQHAADSKASAQQALASSIQGLLRAAEAHERCAISHERLAAAPYSNVEQHLQQATHHRAAAAADRHRAETAQALLSGGASSKPAPPGSELPAPEGQSHGKADEHDAGDTLKPGLPPA